MNLQAREFSVEVGAGLIGACVLLIVGFLVGAFYSPIWSVLLWPELALRSWCSTETFWKATELMLGRRPVNSTPIGILLGVLFWWPVLLLVFLRPLHVGAVLLKLPVLLVAILAVAAIGLLLTLGIFVGMRGFGMVVVLGIVMQVIFLTGGGGSKRRQLPK